ncbi:MAG: YajG family lipoprotein [Elusimicrobiota bacterium]
MTGARPLLGAALCACLGGCAMTRDYVLVYYAPQGSPMKLRGAENAKVRVDVLDRRYIKDRVSSKKNGFGVETAPIIASNSIPDLFAEAIRAELRGRGFQLADGGVQVAAELNRFYGDFKSGMLTGSAVADAAMNVTVKTAGGRSILSKSYSGEGSNSGFARMNGANVKVALDECLRSVLSNLLNDAEFVDALLRGGEGGGPAAEREPVPAAASDVDELPAGRAGARRKAHAIVIGIERYREKLPAARFAASDARLMARYLTEVLGYDAGNVAVLVDGQANKSDFEKYFERWLPNRVEKDDEVFVYFSGHGAPNPESGDAYLVPFDGDPGYLPETAYPVERLYSQLAKLPARSVTVAMDSCFSGAGGRSVLAQGAKPLVLAVPAAVPAGLTVMTASAGDQVSHSYEEKGHGLFTYFLLKGIQSQAVDGPVVFRKVFDYAAPQVSRVARREYNSDQVPQWKGAP